MGQKMLESGRAVKIGAESNGTDLSPYSERPTPDPSREGIWHKLRNTNRFPSLEGVGVGSAATLKSVPFGSD